MAEAFLREEMLLGGAAMDRLARAHVAVFGVGGVGSYCCEALARAGVGALTLVDSDTVSVSNLNRQLCALRSTVGLPKAEVMAARVRDINPDCRVRPLVGLYSEEDKERLRASGCVSVDENACWLIDYWCGKDIRGLIRMPFSRHWIMHIEASLRIAKKG